MVRLEDDLFIIPVDNGNIIYSPLRRGLFWADDDAASSVKEFIQTSNNPHQNIVNQYIEQLKGIEVKPLQSHGINDGSNLVIILSQICNLACSYCYAQEARSKEILDFEKLKITINQIFTNSSKKKHNLTFIGGGEPLVVWDLIKKVILFTESIKGEKLISYHITSNLTLLNDEIIGFAEKYRIGFGVSFEILKDIQDKQRPFYASDKSTFDIIDKNIKILMKHNISFNIRSTITELNVERMSEMVEFVGENYPVLRKVHFEQVTDPLSNGPEFYNKFIAHFMKAREIGRTYNLNVYNSISNSILNIKERFCGGEFCITPTGSIVACHRISSCRDEYYDLFHVGDINLNTGPVINEETINNYLSFSNQKLERCKQCYAYWHCAGICPMERCYLSKEQIESKCEFTRTLVKKILFELATKKNDC